MINHDHRLSTKKPVTLIVMSETSDIAVELPRLFPRNLDPCHSVWGRRERSIYEKHVAAAEQALGRSLPLNLKNRLLRSNGGEVYVKNLETDEVYCWRLFPVWDPTDRKHVGRTTNHIVRETASWRVWCRFPTDAVAIAENGTGDALIIRGGSEVIEYWSHETGNVAAVEIDWRIST